MRHIYIVCSIIIVSSLTGFAQKVKYKDLFILLNAENYEDADRYLRLFLVQEPDHSNANFHMGKMLHSYMKEEDLLNRYDRIIELADSSILHYNMAMEYLTEKDVKRHDDDFYAEFRRRDMRTGKFGVNYNDVELEYQNKIKEVEQYKDDIERMNFFKSKTISFYDSCQTIYLNLTNRAVSINMLYFTAGEQELDELRSLSSLYDSTVYNFNTFRSIIKSISNNKQSQDFTIKVVEDYPVDGKSITNFYNKDVELWNYKQWANMVHDIIGRQIFPLKKRMIAYDDKLTSLHTRVIKDSIDGRTEVFRLATQNVGRDLKNYENNSLPAALYNYRIGDINFHSILNMWYKQVSDSSDVGYKLNFLDDVNKQFSSIAKLLNALQEANTDYSKLVFKDFINERWTNKGIDNFVNHEVEHVNADKSLVKEWKNELLERDKIVLWKMDSISLLPGVQTFNSDSTRYSTFNTDTLSEREIAFYSWLQVDDEFHLAYGVAPSSRVLDTLYSVNLTDSINHQLLLANQYMTDSVGLGQKLWLINTTQKIDSGSVALLFTTDLSTGLVWQSKITLPQVPNSTKPDHDSSTIAILNEDEEVIVVVNSRGEIVEESPPPIEEN